MIQVAQMAQANRLFPAERALRPSLQQVVDCHCIAVTFVTVTITVFSYKAMSTGLPHFAVIVVSCHKLKDRT